MFKRWALIGTTVACLLFGSIWQPAIASAQESRGICKLYLTGGPPVEGEVTEYPDKYEVKLLDSRTGKPGKIVQTVPKTQVKRLEPRATKENPAGGVTAGTPGKRPNITEAMIAEILGSEDISAESLDIEDKVPVDVMAPLEPDEESLRDMLRIAGVNAKYHYTDHFVFVYTSDHALAAKMASNLERVYRWVVSFNEKNGVKSIRPKHKLEIFFFATWDEFTAYMTNNGFMIGALGFYMRTNNRSAFFDMMTYPPTKADLDAAAASKDGNEKRRIQNRVTRAMDNYNASVVQHEAAHHIHFNLGVFPKKGDIPRWMSEGLATMFETIESEAGASYGATNHQRLWEWRRIYGQDGERLPDMRLFILFDGMWQGFPSYCLGWSLNHYLSRAPKHKDKYKDWMKLMAARDDGEQISMAELQREFELLFGDIDEDWVKEFVAFIKAIQLKMSAVRDEDGP